LLSDDGLTQWHPAIFGVGEIFVRMCGIHIIGGLVRNINHSQNQQKAITGEATPLENSKIKNQKSKARAVFLTFGF